MTMTDVFTAGLTTTVKQSKGHHRRHSSLSKYEHSWEPQMAQRIIRESEEKSKSGNGGVYMVGLCGLPGSGKSISSLILANLVEQQGYGCAVLPHDGYHYPMDILRTFPDPEDAVYRRGAPDTFDHASLLRDLKRIKEGDEDLVQIPAFDHAKADPEPNKHSFDRHQHKIVICEGLYVLHEEDGWGEIGDLFDLTIFIDSDIDTCIERVKVRNRCIPGYTPEEIDIRCEVVDRANAYTALRSKHRADVVVDSSVKEQDDPSDNHNNLFGKRVDSKLNLLEAKDTEVVIEADSDWTMDIFSRPEQRDFRRPRTDSVVSERSEPPPPPAAQFLGSWESGQAEFIHKKLLETKSKRRGAPFLVSLVGTPGSGKSCSAFLMANELEKRGIPVMIMPHDGYHYPLEYLKGFPHAEDFIYRRGAPDTFNPSALHRDLLRIKNGDEHIIKLPAFDHARGDPEPDTHVFDRHHHQVVLCEGLYLLHDEDGWSDIADLFDWKIFMDSDVEVCLERVKIRNQCIPGYSPEEIAIRTEIVDRTNCMTVMKSKTRADIVVNSLAMQSK